MADLNRPYIIDFKMRRGYLFAKVTSDSMSLDISIACATDIAKKSTECGTKNILLLRDVQGTMPDSDLFLASTHLIDLTKGKRVAFVNPYPEIAEDLEFAVRIGTNRGAVHRLFGSVESAEKWLLDADMPRNIRNSLNNYKINS